MDRYYGTLIVFPSPLNLVTTGFAPFVLAYKN